MTQSCAGQIAIFLTISMLFTSCYSASPPTEVDDSDAGTDGDIDADTAIDKEFEFDSENDSQGDSVIDSTVNSETDEDTVTEADSVSENGSGSDDVTGSPNECPWECLPRSGANTCSTLADHWVHNTSFDCNSGKEICCQPLGAPDGLTENCADQAAMNCAKSCVGKLVENPNYYCTDATKTCCEDPDGPSYGCYDSGGSCISPFQQCPAGKIEFPIDCPGLINIDKCCLEPRCPWSCEPNIGQKSCSTNATKPSEVRNYNYSCETPSDICCQPLSPGGSETPPEVTEHCSGDMACRNSCQQYEQQTADYYCKNANLICCVDSRPPCGEIGGACELVILGNCSEGKEPDDEAICSNSLQTCCTEIDPENTCAQNGGRCVDLGSSCPILYLPDFNHFCGFTLKTCCMPPIDI